MSAQGTDRSALVGRVTDSTGSAVPDATISAASPALIGGPRSVRTNAVGDFRVTDLAPGTYHVEALRAGFTTAIRNDVHLAADTTLIVDIGLDLASLSESVRVTSATPTVDVTSAAAPSRLSTDLLSNLPTDRVLSDVMNLTPGVNVGIGLGGIQNSNPLYVDGVNVADTSQLSPWAAFNYNWVEDVEIVGVGAGAEYGEFSGVIQKSRLKSGSNQFRGLAEIRITRPQWVGTNTSSLDGTLQSAFAAQSQRILNWRDLNGQLGGPLHSDRLWFFSGVQNFSNDIQPALYDGSASTDTTNKRVLSKIDSAVTRSLRATGFYEYDRSRVTGDGLGPFTPIEATTTDVQPDHNWSARASWMVGDRTTFELEQTGSIGTLSWNPTAPATRSGPYPHYDDATGLSSGNASSFLDLASSRRAIGATLAREVTESVGRRHGLKVGWQQEWNRSDSTQGFPGGRSYEDFNGEPYLVSLWDGDSQAATARRTTVYAQDEWALTERVTLHPGLRATVNRGVVSQGVVLRTRSLSPRIGVAWDVAPGHKTVVRAHYGRYYDATLTTQFGFADERQPAPIVTAEVLAPDTFRELSRSTNMRFALDSHIAQAYFDQWVAGVDHELWRSNSVSAQYIRRRYGNQVGYVDLGSTYEPIVQQDPGVDNRLGTADDGDLITLFRKTNPGNEVYYFTNPEGIYRRYTALQITARKQHGGRWQLQGSYTWSSTSGNAVNAAGSNSGGPDLGYNGVAADPNRAIKADGPMPFDFTHEFKTLGTWRVPVWGGLNVSGVYQFHTGSAWGRTVRFPNIQFVTFGVRIEPRGTRRTGALNTVDLRLEKTLPIGGARQIGVFADAFNVNNQGIPDPSMRRPVIEFSGPSFGQPQFWLAPRTLRIGARVSF